MCDSSLNVHLSVNSDIWFYHDEIYRIQEVQWARCLNAEHKHYASLLPNVQAMIYVDGSTQLREKNQKHNIDKDPRLLLIHNIEWQNFYDVLIVLTSYDNKLHEILLT